MVELKRNSPPVIAVREYDVRPTPSQGRIFLQSHGSSMQPNLSRVRAAASSLHRETVSTDTKSIRLNSVL